MREDGAYITAWGVGTAGSHVPPVGLVQKLAAMYMKPLNGKKIPEGGTLTPTMKIVSAAPAKSSNPGNINSRRFYDADGKLAHILVYDEDDGIDPANGIVNLRDFSERKTNPAGLRGEDILVPVFDVNGKYIYNEPPKKPARPGSSYMVTDLDAIASKIRGQLATLPEGVRRIERPRKDVLQGLLTSAFETARKSGDKTLSLDIHMIERLLPPEQEHIPVYVDAQLFEKRLAVEARHKMHIPDTGVGTYQERFEMN
jgi:hypothetical protein